MNRFIATIVLGIFNYSGRLLLTLVAILVMLMSLRMVMRVHNLLVASQNNLKYPFPILAGRPSSLPISNPSVHPFWPTFPRSDIGTFTTAVINGVQVMTEEWQCNASPTEVLSYYRDQMAARGWRDVTDQTQPEPRGSANSLQDDRDVTKYRNFLDSNLMLNRDDWSMNISTEPAKQGNGNITVKIFVAATPSIRNLFIGMASAFAVNKEQGGQPMDVVQYNGREHYHTRIEASSSAPDRAFQEKLAVLGSQGWHPMLLLPKQQTPNGYFLWLVRGTQYAALSVNASPQGKGSSVMLTEVTPEAGQK